MPLQYGFASWGIDAQTKKHPFYLTITIKSMITVSLMILIIIIFRIMNTINDYD